MSLYDALHEPDFWYWPQGGPCPTGPATDALQVFAYASTGMTCLTLGHHGDDEAISAWDACVSAHCAFAIMGMEANPVGEA